jgi:Putative beta-barrel porin 2
MTRFKQVTACAIGIVAICVSADVALAQESPGPTLSLQNPVSVVGASGWANVSQYANPAILGSLYLTPKWPMTGYYSHYPGNLTEAFPGDGVSAGPLRVHPHMGVAHMYTDNVFRTNSNKRGDFLTTLAPGIQAQLPFAGFHSLIVDYRTNIQYYARTPANDVQDQTASGRVNLDFPGGLKIDLQGEHKLGHDPRGSAVDDQNIQRLDVNKWTANGFTGQAEYRGARSSIKLNLQTMRWDYLNNGLGIVRDRRSNYAGLTFLAEATAKTSLVANVGVIQSIYDQNKNLNNETYVFSGGGTWNVTDLTSGEFQVGYQHIQFSRASVRDENNLSSPLNQFTRDKNAHANVYFMGKLNWQATPLLTISVQPYRTIQQTAIAGNLFYTATGANLSAKHVLTDGVTVDLNLGIEHDKFQRSSSTATGLADRSDTLKNVAVGVTYRAVKWVGLGLQYIFEDRDSSQTQYSYQANTFMVSLQGLL